MIRSKPILRASLLGALTALLASTQVRGEFLFNSFIVPDASLSADRSSWDVFYSPYDGANYPDIRAPYGTRQTAADAGFTVPANSNPANPTAFFDTRNATVTQTQAGRPGAFIIDPGSSGNIYSFSSANSYRLDNSTAGYTTPYDLGTVAFQFQTAGTLIDFSTVRLQYTDAANAVHTLAPNELLREYRGDTGSSFGGLTNRAAIQWDLSGLGIRTYQILFNAAGSSNSLQIATLATTSRATEIVPTSRAWSNGGSGNWSTGFSSPQGATGLSPNTNGNVRFTNAAAASTTLDGNYTIGELRFGTAANVTVNSPGGYVLTSNTGITTVAASTGVYAVNAGWALGAFNVFDIAAGTVQLNGVVTGAYGFEKDNDGTLALSGNNTFTGSVNVGGGTLRLGGPNTYAGSTTVTNGSLVVGSDGALGSATSNIALGADSSLFTFTGTASAALVLDGSRTVSRSIDLANGGYEKRLAATNASGGATISGAVNFGTADNVKLTATAASDRLIFSGAMSGGAATSTVTTDGAGTVVFSGAEKSYANATAVSAGMLQITSGTSFTGAGATSVNNGATLRVDGTLGGGGTLTLNAGVLTGSGTVSRTFAVGTGATLAPGNGVGTLTTAGETWSAGGTYQFELNSTAAGSSGINPGQDLVRINGGLSLTASAANRFTLQLRTLTAAGTAGSLAGFDPAGSYAWKIATTSGGISGFDPAEFAVDRSGFGNAAAGTFSVSQIGNDLYLNYAPVPEPSTWFLIGAGMVAAGFAGRRRPRGPQRRDNPPQPTGSVPA